MPNRVRCRNCAKCAAVKEQTDALLKEAAALFANEGKDSTQEELNEAYRKEHELMLKIAELDPELGATLLQYSNQTDTERPAEISE